MATSICRRSVTICSGFVLDFAMTSLLPQGWSLSFPLVQKRPVTSACTASMSKQKTWRVSRYKTIGLGAVYRRGVNFFRARLPGILREPQGGTDERRAGIVGVAGGSRSIGGGGHSLGGPLNVPPWVSAGADGAEGSQGPSWPSG